MTGAGTVYAQALYDLAREEQCEEQIRAQLAILQQSIEQAPDFLKLLSAPNLSKEERCGILDASFRDKVHPYILNCMKLLTEKGYIRHFPDCCRSYKCIYNQDHGILEVTAVSAKPLSQDQGDRLKRKLEQVTGKKIELICRVDPQCLGGIRLDYDGKRVDGTVQNRLDTIRSLLKNTVL